MKIAIVLGRGIEGCGITRIAIEYKSWLEKNDFKADIFALIEKKFSRHKSHDFQYQSFSPKDDVSSKLNSYNKVIYVSVPSIKNSNECISNFLKYWVRKVNKPQKVFIQGDHLKQSIQRNARMWDVVEHCDLAFTYSKNSYFGIEFNKRFNSDSIFPDKDYSMPLHTFRVGMDFDSLKDYRKRFKNKKSRISYMGRFARFKNLDRVLDLRKHLKKKIIVEMRGVEQSIGALDIYNHPQVITKENNQSCFDKTYVYGLYARNDGLEELSSSKFGCSFYELDNKFYGSHIEYAMLELVGTGTIPIFSKHFGDNVKHISGKSFSSIRHSGIFMDRNNIDDVCEEIETLNNNQKSYDNYVDDCLSIYEAHSSSDRTWTDLQESMG